jgi:hypothetical protein
MRHHEARAIETRRTAGRLRSSASALGLVALTAAAAPAASGAPVAGPLVQVSGPSPISGCTADDVSSQPGTNYPNTEIEPWVEINPTNANNIIAGWQQDRWSNGGARTLVAGASTNGGTSWSGTVLPGITRCPTPTASYQRATDPWLTFAPDGAAYFMSLVLNPDPPTGGFGANAMVVSKSTNGGASWGPPITLLADPDGPALNDQNAITADPTNANFVYAVWDRLEEFPTRGSGRTNILQRLGSPDGTDLARSRLRAAKQIWNKGSSPVNQPFLQFKGPALLARTADAGASWEPPKVVYDPGLGNQTIANQVVVRPTGAMFQFFTEILNTAPGGLVNLAYKVSTDRGNSFGPLQRVGPISSEGVVTPNRHEPVRDGSILFDLAVDRANGNLYAVWQDRRFAKVEQVAFSMSSNGGVSWSSPIRVSQTPPNRNKLREQAFIPSVAVADNGVVAVTYYDFRFDGADGELTDYWAVFCTSNCSSPSSWKNEVRLTNASFDMQLAPVAGGRFLGDYMGLAASGTTVRPVFGIATGANLTDLFTRTIDVSSVP